MATSVGEFTRQDKAASEQFLDSHGRRYWLAAQGSVYRTQSNNGLLASPQDTHALSRFLLGHEPSRIDYGTQLFYMQLPRNARNVALPMAQGEHHLYLRHIRTETTLRVAVVSMIMRRNWTRQGYLVAGEVVAIDPSYEPL